MKYPSLFLFIVIAFNLAVTNSYGQKSIPVPLKDSLIFYEEVVKVDSSIKQNDLLLKTKQWVAKNFVTSSTFNPIQLEDKENGVLILFILLNEIHSSWASHDYIVNVSFNGKIQVKDGRFKYTFSDFNYSRLDKYDGYKEDGKSSSLIEKSQKGTQKKQFSGYLENINTQMEALIQSLKKSLAEPLSDKF